MAAVKGNWFLISEIRIDAFASLSRETLIASTTAGGAGGRDLEPQTAVEDLGSSLGTCWRSEPSLNQETKLH